MDFDLFEPDEDDSILSSISMELTQISDDGINNDIIAEFQCQGEDALNSQFSPDGFIKNCFLQYKLTRKNKVLEELALGTYNLQRHQFNGSTMRNFLFSEACINIQSLIVSVQDSSSISLDEISFYRRRHEVTLMYHVMLQSINPEEWHIFKPHFGRLRALVNNCIKSETWKLIYFANSCKGNECNIPAYHLLHGVLEWTFLDLCILYKYDFISITNHIPSPKCTSEILNQYENILNILLTCSIFYYAKKRCVELLFSSPFPCVCIKEVWLLLQLIIQKWPPNVEVEAEKLTFWSLFNKVMDNIKSKMDNYSLTSLSYCEFANWMLHALVRLHGFRSNGIFVGPNYSRLSQGETENAEFLERITQQFLNANPNEEQLRVYIGLLTPTLLEWWQPKVNIPMILWEYFHKKLNSSFYIVGAAPSNLAVSCSSGQAYLDKYRSLLNKSPDANLSSYTLFILLMGKSLQRLLTSHAKHQSQKLLGRIYTKFSAQKLLALNETGIHHLIELFLVLSLCGDFSDLSGKLRDLLLSIALEKVTPPKQEAIAKGHMALLILHAEHHYDLTDYVTKLLQQLSAIRNDLAVSKIMANSLLDIFNHADNFQRGEHLLLSSWIPNFLNNCTPVEQERTLEALHTMLVKIRDVDYFVDANNEVLKALNNTILPFVKQQYISNFSHWLPILAADFCIHFSMGTDTQSFQKLFSYYIEHQPANRQAVSQFLLKVLESERGNLVDHTVIMQIWLKSLVVLTANNEDVAKLTKIVVKLPEFTAVTNINADEMLQAKEPLCVFIAAVGKKYETTIDYTQRSEITNNFNSYLRNFEKWLNVDFKLEKSELIFRFYSFLAIVIFNCPQIVYTKSKITCFFHIAITRYILPTTIQMGKAPEGKLAQLIHKIWPVVIQGIGRLNFKTDAYLNKTLTDLIQKWTPHFKISSNAKQVARPFITCLQGDNHDLSLFIFEKLTSLFLSTQRRQADPNACLVITIYQEVVESISLQSNDKNSIERLLTFMKGCCLSTLEHIMMVDEIVPSRQLLLDLFKRIINSPVFKKSVELKDLLSEHIRILSKKHLSFHTFFFFELLMKLSTISYELIEAIMPFLIDEVKVVEAKRGTGEDNRIRGCLSKLQHNIELYKQKRL